MTANLIPESMYVACDDSGNEYVMVDLIVDYRNNYKAITVPDQKVVHRGRRFMRRSNVGCQMCVQWRDSSTTWKALKDIKESHPIERAEYVVDQEIYHKLSINWWVNAVLNNMLRIISLCKEEKRSLPQENS